MRILALCLAALIAQAASAQYNVPVARLTQTLRIEGASEDLTAPAYIFVAADGRIGIAQPMDMKALIYSADGKRIATVGRNGSGPGEFRSIGAAGWLGDKFWVSDYSLRSVSIFSSDGKHEITRSLKSVSVPATVPLPAGSASFSPVALAIDGTMMAFRSAPSRENPPPILVRVNSRDEIDRIVVQHPPDDAQFAFTSASGRNFYTRVSYATSYAELIGADGKRAGFVEARVKAGSGTIRVLLLSASGDTLVSRVESFSPVRVTQAERDSAVMLNRKGWESPQERIPSSELDAMDVAMRARIPEYHSPLSSAIMGIDNTIWIGLGVPWKASRWVMLNDRGIPEVSVTLPPRSRVMQASRTTIWSVEYDADGLPNIVRYRIDR